MDWLGALSPSLSLAAFIVLFSLLSRERVELEEEEARGRRGATTRLRGTI
jgi:hypothetical protein